MLWLEVLDQAIGWARPDGLRGPTPGSILENAALLRRVCASQLLGRELERDDQEMLFQWLEDVMILVEPKVLRRLDGMGPGSLEPVLRARRRRSDLPEPFETLLSTALVQFLAQWQGSLVEVVSRCHGICRGPAPTLGLAAEWEEEFARQADLLDVLRTGDMHQCPRFVWSERGSRYCSKACSNASFAARKALAQPRYFAEKQERYRLRQERKKKPRRDPGAFVYMD